MKTLINFRPIMKMAISICLGIAVAYLLFSVSILSAVITSSAFLLLSVIVVLVYGRKSDKIINLVTLLLVILTFFGGFFITNFKLNRYANASLNNHFYEVSAKIDKITDYGGYQTVICDSVKFKGVNGGETDYKIRLSVYGYKSLSVGDRIFFNATLKDNGAYYNSRFSAEQISEGIKYSAEILAEELTVTNNEKNIFQKINVYISNSLKQGLNGDEYGIAFALLTGDSSFIDGEVLQNFRSAGIAHVFAVSGLHIGVLAVAINFILSKLKVNKKISAIITVSCCIFYSGVCGFSASSLRATIMCAVSLFAGLTGEKYDGVSSVCLAGVLILLFDPLQMFCVGFQLSFGVVLGIFILAPTISKLFKFLPKRISESLGVTLSAQIVSVPVCLSAFSNVSLVSAIFNIVMIPVISPLFVVLLFTALIGGVFSISAILLFPIKYVLTALIVVINFLDYGKFMVGGITLGFFTLLYYGSTIIASGFVNIKKTAKLILCVIVATAMILGVSIKSVNDYIAVKCYVSGNKNFSAVMLKSRDENALILSVCDGDFSLSGIRALKNQASVEVIDKIIFSGYFDESLVQETYSKLHTVIGAKQIYYFGEQNFMTEKVIEQCFDGVDAINYLDFCSIEFSTHKIISEYQGKLIITETNGLRHAVLSEVGVYDNEILERISNCTTVIAYDCQEFIFSGVENAEKISFTKYRDYANGETDGIYRFKLKYSLK